MSRCFQRSIFKLPKSSKSIKRLTKCGADILAFLMALVVAVAAAVAAAARWGEAALLKKPKDFLPFFFLPAFQGRSRKI